MSDVSTIIDEVKRGNVPEPIKEASLQEPLNAEELAEKIASGRAIVPYNRRRKHRAIAIGEGLFTKINANIGTSPVLCNFSFELEKLKVAIKYGAHSVMDLSTGGNLGKIRKELIKRCSVIFGTVPVYQVFREKEISEVTIDDFFDVLKKHAEDGVDFVTIHCGVTKKLVELIEQTERIGGIVSRGGVLMARWIKQHERENPFYEYFDRVLEIAREFELTLSLGDGMRPGAISDASDRIQFEELDVLAELTKRCHDAGVQVMIEGPGHVPINKIKENVIEQKRRCNGAPFYVLGPLVTDIAPGYDHITAAIGGALAAYFGVDFLCYVTPAEHLTLPDIDDVKQGVIASRIAAHAGDIAKGIPGAEERDKRMSIYRRNLNWDGMFEMAIDPELARKRREKSGKLFLERECSMCGDLCSIAGNKDLEK